MSATLWLVLLAVGFAAPALIGAALQGRKR